jgi:crotonobetainyl-CoA:carnitine CoA-transferase CaiB-like acyl-CoA transferase/NAD(P)-dependent dehydrogenase (short-subunit alcohol dehydrogenase family)
MQSPAQLPLAGIRVLDFSNLLPGPLASLLLAEAGAEIIKIERAGTGDEMRGYPPAWGEASGNFALLNRGKTSLCADLKNEGDRAHVRELARSADVLIEQFRPGVMARLGLDHETLRADNPRLVYCSITGYGQTGDRALKAGHDLNYLAETGLLGLTRSHDGAPVLPQVLAADIGAGAYPAVINILLALQQRAHSGRGCHIDVAMCDNLFTFAYWGLSAGLAGGRWPRPGGELTTGGSPRYGIYRTSDGEYLAAAPIEDRFWRIFCDGIGLAEADRDDRADPASTIRKVAERIGTRTAAEWRERFAGVDACVSVVESLQHAFSDPAFAGRGLFDRLVSARGVAMPALPVPVAGCLREASRERPFPDLDPARRRGQWSLSREPASRPYDLGGLRILVTGASDDIGQATARLCASLGARLVLADRSPAPALLDALRADGRDHRFRACDVDSPDDIEQLCGSLGEVDVAVLNPVVLPASGSGSRRADGDFDPALHDATRATALLARRLIAAMKERGRGRLVLLGSFAARAGGAEDSPSSDGAAEGSPLREVGAEASLHAMVRFLSRSATPQVLVNAVAVRSVAVAPTPHGRDEPVSNGTPAPRFARPDAIAWPIAFLCSPGASLVRETVLPVDGGARLR